MRFKSLIIAIFILVNNAPAQTAAERLQAADIKLLSVNGDSLELTSLRGKVVLVDFWASWCGPCRLSNRNLVTLYTKYHHDGFEIFSVSIDNDTLRWKAAIMEDKMNWLQVNQTGGWRSDVVKQWGIGKIPASFLINREGRIVSNNPSYGVLDKWLEDLLRTNNNTK